MPTHLTSERRTAPTIGLLLESIGSHYGSALIAGVADAAQAHGVNLLCFATGILHDPTPSEVQRSVLYDLVGPNNVDGLLITSATLSLAVGTDVLGRFCERYRPLPMVSLSVALPQIPSVVMDFTQGTHAALKHLIEVHGRRRIALGFYEGPTLVEAKAQVQVYRETMASYGLTPAPPLFATPPNFQSSAGELWSLFGQHLEDLDAVLVNTDLSKAFIEALQAHGVQVPEQCAVVGHQDLDTPEMPALFHPSLTAVHWPLYEVGYQGLETVLAQLQGETVPLIATVPTTLVVRQSCGCLAGVVAPLAIQPVAASAPLPITARREFLRERNIQAMGTTQNIQREWTGRLSEAFTAAVAEEDDSRFLNVLEAVLQAASVDHDVPVWQRIIAEMNHSLSLTASLTAQLRAERLSRTAMELIYEMADWKAAVQRAQLGDQLWRVGCMTSGALSTIFDEAALIEAAARASSDIRIASCFLSLYVNPEQPLDELRLIMAYTEQGRVKLEPGGRCFPTSQLAPRELWPRDRNYVYIVEPLYLHPDRYGLVLFERAPELATIVYESLHEQLSGALKSIWLYRAAESARHEAEEANRLKSRFLATVSHELRTPLNVIVGLSQMQADELKQSGQIASEQYRHDLEQINTSAQHLNWLIRDVLDLASSQAGQLRLACAPLKLTEVLQVLITAGGQMAHEKGLAWQANLPAELPTVWGDVTRLRQVGLNLISNAVKFTTSGQVSLTVTTDEKTVTISVSDTGIGIPPAEQQSIFDEFRQSERTTARGYGGLGLGLAISKRLVEMHGGEIGVHSSGQEQAGSTFYFRLPILAVSPLTDLNAPDSLRQTTVLVTTQADSGERLQTCLSQQGFDSVVRLVDSHTDWITALLSNVELPGAIVLDQPVAVEQGWELLKALKQTPGGQDVTVLFYTLEGDTGSLLTLDYLHKPLNASELTQALERQGLGPDRETKTILVVDDEPGILDIHTRMVQAQSPTYRVLQARNGREALAIIQATPPNLILLDLMMPELDGFGVLEALRAQPATRDIPVMVLTAQILTEADMIRLNRGVTTVLEKGVFSLAETLTRMESALARSRKLGSEAQRLVRKAMAYIHAHYAEPLTREDIASYVTVSQRHLTHCFDQETGLSPMAYLNRYRIRQAKTLLSGSGKSVAEIALEVGFSRGSYLARVFKKEVGQTPQAYRANQAGH